MGLQAPPATQKSHKNEEAKRRESEDRKKMESTFFTQSLPSNFIATKLLSDKSPPAGGLQRLTRPKITSQ
jgi:hypothetical protein